MKNFFDDDEASGGNLAFSLQPKIFEEAFKKLPLKYQTLIVLSAIRRSTSFMAKQFSVCTYLYSVDVRNSFTTPLTEAELKYIESEERILAELYREPTQKPN